MVSLLPVEAQSVGYVPGSSWLDLLPDGEEKRRFIIECTGCHSPSYIYSRNNRWLTQAEWEARITQMLSYYGPRSGFPIIGNVDRTELASWLVQYWNADSVPSPVPQADPSTADAEITEWRFPGAGPHDLFALVDGTIAITGMFDNDMWVLNPETGRFDRHDMPGQANPRAMDVDAEGNWWIVFGNPKEVARYNPQTRDIELYDVGIYAHSIALDAEGRAWANGHFTTNPIRVAMIDPSTDSITFYDVPTENSSYQVDLPISYDLIDAPDGTIWMTELNWNRISGLNPVTGEVRSYELPTPHSAPRRLDISPDGILWIPEYANDRLARFDPATESWTEYAMPRTGVDPYVVRYDAGRNAVWVAYSTGDAVAKFDVATETFTEYRLPTRYALIRHMVIDAAGDVWFSYHHVPTMNDRIVRLRVE